MGRGDARSDSDDSVQWEDFFGPSLEISGTLLAMYDSLASELRSDQAPSRPPARRPLSSSSDCSSSSSSSSSLLPAGLGGVKKSYLASVESLEEDDAPSGALRGNRTLCRTAAFADSNAVAMHRGLLGHPHGAEARCGPDQPSYLDRVLLEVVDTERTYVRDIGAIVEGYLKPLSQMSDSRLKSSELKSLFGNIESIYVFNSGFLEQLEKCGFDPVSIARCFVANSSGFAVYTEFCTSYPTTVSTLTELVGKAETAEIFKARQASLHHSLPLGSYLLKPVQRILKYHLLLQNIVKHVDKESPGYPDVKNALSVMTGIAYHINDMKRRHEHAVRVQEIQSLLYGWQGEDLTTYGELLAEGCLRLVGAKGTRHLLLFEQLLLVAKQREGGVLRYKSHVLCANLMLIESIRGQPLCFQVVPFNSPDCQYSFQARSLEQKREWCLQLKRAIIESFSAVIPSHAKQLVLELGQNDRTLLRDQGPAKKALAPPEYLKRRRYDRRKSESSLHRALHLSRGPRKALLRKSCSCQPVSYQRISTSEPAEFKCCTECTPPGSPTVADQKSGSSLATTSRSELTPAAKPETRTQQELQPRSDGEKMRHPRWKELSGNSVDTSDTENEDGGACVVDVRRLLRYRPSVYAATGRRSEEEIPGEYVTFEFASRHISQQNYNDGLCAAGTGSGGGGGDLTTLWARLGARCTASTSGSLVQRSHSFTEVLKCGTSPRCSEGTSLGHPKQVRRENSVPEDWLNSLEEHLPANACKRCGSLPPSFRHDISNSGAGGTKSHQLRARMERLGLPGPEQQQRPFTIASDQPSRADFIDGPRQFAPQSGGGESQFSSQEFNSGVSVENLASSSVVHPEHRIYRRDTVHGGSLRGMLLGLGTKLTRALWSPPTHDDADDNHLNNGSSQDSVRSTESKLAQLKIIGSLSKACASVIHSKTRQLSRSTSMGGGVQGNASAAARIARQKEPDYCIPHTILAILNKKNPQPEQVEDQVSKPPLRPLTPPSARPLNPPEGAAMLEFLDDDTDSDHSDSSADSYYERTFEAIEDVLAEDMFRDSAIYSDPEEVSGSEHELAAVKVSSLSRRVSAGGVGELADKPPVGDQQCRDLLTAEKATPVVESKQQQQQQQPSSCASSPGVVPRSCRQKGWVKHLVDKFQAGMGPNS
ncbi:guanine nucleotide exchange factor in mesoderm [Haemaphysalis longicornis]